MRQHSNKGFPILSYLLSFINPSINNYPHWSPVISPSKPIFTPRFFALFPQPILKNKIPNNLNHPIIIEHQLVQDNNMKKPRKPNENGISTLQLLQNIAKRIKEKNPNIKHRQAIALAGEKYRQQNQTIRIPKNKLQKITKKSKPCQKCKYCKK